MIFGLVYSRFVIFKTIEILMLLEDNFSEYILPEDIIKIVDF